MYRNEIYLQLIVDMKRSYGFDKKVEEAISLLVTHINSTGHNPKPVILHSIRVGISLYKRGYSEEIVLAGFLHDLLEDTSASEGEIKNKFGERVIELVLANSYNENIENAEDRYNDTFRKCLKVGKDALIVKAADILDNLPYYSWPNDSYVTKKINSFIELAKPVLDNDPIFEELIIKFEAANS